MGYNGPVKTITRSLVKRFSKEFAEAHSLETAPDRLVELLWGGCHGLVVVAAYLNPSTPRASIAMIQLVSDRRLLQAWEEMAWDLQGLFDHQVRVTFEHMGEWYFLDPTYFGFR